MCLRAGPAGRAAAADPHHAAATAPLTRCGRRGEDFAPRSRFDQRGGKLLPSAVAAGEGLEVRADFALPTARLTLCGLRAYHDAANCAIYAPTKELFHGECHRFSTGQSPPPAVAPIGERLARDDS